MSVQDKVARRVLLVGLPSGAANPLARALAAGRSDWEWTFAATPDQAITELARQSADAVVAMQSGASTDPALFLNDVMLCYPQSLRFLITASSAWSRALKALGAAHQFLIEPCDATKLIAGLERAFAYNAWLPHSNVCQVLSRLQRIPSPPSLYFQVVQDLNDPNRSLEEVGRRIARDPAMSAKLLQWVNSAVFGLGQTVTDPGDAVLYLGADTTKSLILLAHTFSYFEGILPSKFTIEEWWRHSLATAGHARRIAELENADRGLCAECYTAGLLHDLGRLALAANLPQAFNEILQDSEQRGGPLYEAEERILGANHAEVGASLLSIWGLSPALVEAVALHHYPTRLLHAGFCPLAAVHAANALDHQIRGEALEGRLDRDYFVSLGLADRVEVWTAACQADGANPD